MIRTAFALVSLCLFAGATGCSSPASAPANEISGSVTSTSLTAQSAIARYGAVSTSTVNGKTTQVRGLKILISDKPNTCAAFHAQSSTNLAVAIPGDTVSPGTFTIVNGVTATATAGQCEVDFDAVDQSCKDTIAQPSTAGSIDITAVVYDLTDPTGSHVAGTIDATFASGHVNGNFDAVLCPDETDADAGTAEADAGPAPVVCTP